MRKSSPRRWRSELMGGPQPDEGATDIMGGFDGSRLAA
jgi:hypothetical protein